MLCRWAPHTARLGKQIKALPCQLFSFTSFKTFLARPGPLCVMFRNKKKTSRVLSSPPNDEPRTRIQPTSGVHACGAVCFHFRFLTPKNATYSPRVQVHVLHCHCPSWVSILASFFLLSLPKKKIFSVTFVLLRAKLLYVHPTSFFCLSCVHKVFAMPCNAPCLVFLISHQKRKTKHDRVSMEKRPRCQIFLI